MYIIFYVIFELEIKIFSHWFTWLFYIIIGCWNRETRTLHNDMKFSEIWQSKDKLLALRFPVPTNKDYFFRWRGYKQRFLVYWECVYCYLTMDLCTTGPWSIRKYQLNSCCKWGWLNFLRTHSVMYMTSDIGQTKAEQKGEIHGEDIWQNVYCWIWITVY